MKKEIIQLKHILPTQYQKTPLVISFIHYLKSSFQKVNLKENQKPPEQISILKEGLLLS